MGFGAMAGPGHGAKVAQPGLTQRPAIIGGHMPLGVIEIHAGTDAGSEGEDISDLSGPDRRPQPLRYLITIDRRCLGRIQHRLYPHLTAATAQQLHQLLNNQRAAVLGPDQRITGPQRSIRQMEMEHHPRSCCPSVERWRDSD
jgi:hypothetical protein